MTSLKVPLKAFADLTIGVIAQIGIVMEILASTSLLFLSVVYGRVVAFVAGATVVAEATVAFADGRYGRGVERIHLDHVFTRSS
jgi:hypothetical protein